MLYDPANETLGQKGNAMRRIGDLLTAKTYAVVFLSVSACLACVCEAAAGTVGTSNDPCATVMAMAYKLNHVDKFRTVNRRVRAGKVTAFENIMIGGKYYTRRDNRPWRVRKRTMADREHVSNCKFINAERTNGIDAKVYEYDRRLRQTVFRVRMWIGEDSGLPVKSHWKEIEPNVVPLEYDVIYDYEENLKEPV
jgi:hypothetical protein